MPAALNPVDPACLPAALAPSCAAALPSCHSPQWAHLLSVWHCTSHLLIPHPPPTHPPCSVPDAALAKQLGLNESLLQSLMELPGTRSMLDLKIRLVSLADLNTSLRK